MRWRGSAYGRNVVSNMALTCLSQHMLVGDAGPVITLERVHHLADAPPDHIVTDDFCTVSHSPAGWRNEFHGWATVMVSPDGTHVRALAHPGCTRTTLMHLSCDMVLPAAVAATAMMAFHASAVGLADGALMFLGPSGRGKSFLSMALALQGAAFMADDHVTISRTDDCFYAHLAYPGARLHLDSIQVLWGRLGAVATFPVAQYTDKRRIRTSLTGISTADRMPVRACVVLGDEHYQGPATLTPMRPSVALGAMAEQVMTNYQHNRVGQQLVVEDVAQLVERIPVFHLDYERCATEVKAVAELLCRLLSR